MSRLIEIRSYELRPGARKEFHRLVLEQSIPMLERWKVDVVAFGPSAHEENAYYLIRSYRSLAERRESQDAFYGSAEWRDGPRAAILALIEKHTSTVLEVSDAVVDELRSRSEGDEAPPLPKR